MGRGMTAGFLEARVGGIAFWGYLDWRSSGEVVDVFFGSWSIVGCVDGVIGRKKVAEKWNRHA